MSDYNNSYATAGSTIKSGAAGGGVDRVPGFGPRLEGAGISVAALCDRVAVLADRLVGGQPPSTQSETGKLSTVANGIFNGIEDTANRICERVRWANEQLTRIEQALP